MVWLRWVVRHGLCARVTTTDQSLQLCPAILACRVTRFLRDFYQKFRGLISRVVPVVKARSKVLGLQQLVGRGHVDIRMPPGSEQLMFHHGDHRVWVILTEV